MQSIARVNRVYKDKPGGLVVDYIGIGSFLKEALFNYTQTDRNETAIPQEEAIAIMLNKYQMCKSMFFNFKYGEFFSGKASNQISILASAMEHILSQNDGKNKFLQIVTELSKAFALSVPNEKALQISEEIGFFQAVRTQILKTLPSNISINEKMNNAIKNIISESIASQGVVDIFGALGIEKPEVSPLLSDKFLEDVKKIPQKNLTIELLKKMLTDDIILRSSRNVVQSRKFSEMLDRSIKKYQNRSIETAQIIEELISLAKDMKKSNERGEKMNLTEDELAFYDALDDCDNDDILKDEILRDITIDLIKTIKNNITIDWTVKENVQAKMRSSIKRILRKYGYPPDKQEKATQVILEQAKSVTNEVASQILINKKIQISDQKPVLEKVKGREDPNMELKSSFRYDIKMNQSNPKVLEKVISKTVAAFMNSEGGILFIGVDDDGNILGLEKDYQTLKKKNSDGFEIELRNSIEKYTKNKIANECIKLKFHQIEDKEICEVIVAPSPRPIIIKDENGKEESYVRVGNSSKPYTMEEFIAYCERHFLE